jgi:hypothetical protein
MNTREVGRGIVWFVIGLVVASVPAYLLRKQPVGRPDPEVVRSYPVRPEIANEMRSALNEAVAPTTGARVSLSPDGSLVVVARESVQSGVKDLLARVDARKPEPTPSIHFEVWVVSGTPATGATPDNRPGLTEVAPALTSIQKSAGPQRFELIEKLALQARSGEEDNQVQGAFADLRVTPTVRRDSKGDPLIAAKILLSARSEPRGFIGGGPPQGSLKALTELRPGELLVIGQSSLARASAANAPPKAPEQVYYIVRATL